MGSNVEVMTHVAMDNPAVDHCASGVVVNGIDIILVGPHSCYNTNANGRRERS